MQQIIWFLGGLSLLFLGMERLSAGISSLFRPGIRSVEPAGGFLTGFVWTVLAQSSSAVAACLISLAEAGIYSPADCLPMLLGANVGTTVTVWLMSLLRVVRLDGIGLLFVFFAFLLKKRTNWSSAAFGLGLVLCGMELMQLSAEPFRGTVLNVSSPAGAFLGVMGFTAVVQSSAVAIGALQMMEISLPVAFAAVLGANIGTCGTGILTAAMLGRAAKTVALLELGINVLSAMLLLPLVYFLPARMVSPAQIAAIHTLVNAITAAVFLPCLTMFQKGISIEAKKQSAR